MEEEAADLRAKLTELIGQLGVSSLRVLLATAKALIEREVLTSEMSAHPSLAGGPDGEQ